MSGGAFKKRLKRLEELTSVNAGSLFLLCGFNEANKEFPDPDDYEEHYENQMWNVDDDSKNNNYFEEIRFSETLYIEAVKKWRKKWFGSNEIKERKS